MKHLKIILAVFALLLLAGVGCHVGGTDTNFYDDTYAPYDYGDDSYDYDDSYDSGDSSDPYGSDYYSNVPQGSQTVYACNLDQDYCEYETVEISGSYVTSSNNGSRTIFPDESFCDEEGCYFVDDLSSQWYFEF